MSEIRDKHGAIIGRSRNLSGILRYPRKYPRSPWATAVTAVEIIRTAHGGGHLIVTYADGAVGTDSFADYSVLCGWLAARRSWYGARLTVAGQPAGEIDSKNMTLRHSTA